MSGHTPGPWVIDGDQIITAEAGIPICVLHMEDEVEWGGPDLIAEVEANARLIAAAPDLLAALKRLAAMLVTREDIEEAREVIAKAEVRP